MHTAVSENMDYIQALFLRVQDFMHQNHGLAAVYFYLEAEPPAFRSIAYESAALALALRDLEQGTELQTWQQFYQQSDKAHSFHMEIGLGWAMAKTGVFPAPALDAMSARQRRMVFDGVGYYYGLFRGRRTVRFQEIPEHLAEPDLPGFDQGLGRRLWYMAKGEVDELRRLMQPFAVQRHPALWRGIGIACGYVGGIEGDIPERLAAEAGDCRQHLCAGIVLATISRRDSGSLTDNLELVLLNICGNELQDFADIEALLPG